VWDIEVQNYLSKGIINTSTHILGKKILTGKTPVSITVVLDIFF
jgi:hypothetical protein